MFFHGSNLNDLYQLFSILHQYVGAGVNPEEGIALYAKDESLRPSVRKVLASVLHDLHNGNDLALAMSKHPKFFPSYIVEMMRVNSRTGQANAIYESIEQNLEQEIDLRRSVSSDVWPIMIMLLALIIGFGIATFVILPMMSGMLKDMGVEMPTYSMFFLNFADAAQNYWYLFLLAVAGIVGAYLYVRNLQPLLYARIMLRLPLYGNLIYQRVQYQFARTFGLCIEAGVETTHALQFTAMAVNNLILQNTLLEAVNTINRSGTDLVTALKKANTEGIIDPSYYTMLKAAEKGNMDQILANRAVYFKKQLLEVSKTFGTKLQTLIITPGFIILISVFISVYMPIFNLMGNIGAMGGAGIK